MTVVEADTVVGIAVAEVDTVVAVGDDVWTVCGGRSVQTGQSRDQGG